MLVLIAKHLLFLNFVYVYKRHICAPKCIAEAKDTKKNTFSYHIQFVSKTIADERVHKRGPQKKKEN